MDCPTCPFVLHVHQLETSCQPLINNSRPRTRLPLLCLVISAASLSMELHDLSFALEEGAVAYIPAWDGSQVKSSTTANEHASSIIPPVDEWVTVTSPRRHRRHDKTWAQESKSSPSGGATPHHGETPYKRLMYPIFARLLKAYHNELVLLFSLSVSAFVFVSLLPSLFLSRARSSVC